MNEKNKIILGTMGLGGGWNHHHLTKEDIKKANEVILCALEAGINTFDHADIYAFGKAEQVFGEVFKSHKALREELIIQSKTGIILPSGERSFGYYNNSKSYIIKQVELILKRLDCEYLDILLIHRPDVLMNGYEIAETFTYLKEREMVKQFGVSNMSVSQIEMIQHFWSEKLVANQIQLSIGHHELFDMEVDVNNSKFYDQGLQGLLQYCQMNELILQAYSPLDKGRFLKLKELQEKDQKLANKLIEIGNKYQVSNEVIQLSWLLKLPVTIHPIIGTTNTERIKESVKALDVHLTHEEWYEIYILSLDRYLP